MQLKPRSSPLDGRGFTTVPLIVNLGVACWVEEYPVVGAVWATYRAGDNMMVVPSGYVRDRLVTHNTVTVLPPPKIEQVLLVPQVPRHLDTYPLCKVAVPCGIKWVCICFNLDVPFDGYMAQTQQ